MTLIERLLELRLHVKHLRTLRPNIERSEQLEEDLSLRNDLLHSLQTVCQIVIDVAGELSARQGLPFEDYTTAIRNLSRLDPPFAAALVAELEPLPGFRNVVIHDYVALDLERAIEALDRLDPVEEFADAVAARLDQESEEE